MIITPVANFPMWSISTAHGHWAVGRVIQFGSEFVASMNGDAALRALEHQIGRPVKRLSKCRFASLDDAAAYLVSATV